MESDDYLQTIHAHLRSAYLLSEEKIASVMPTFLTTLTSHLQRLEQAAQSDDLKILGKAGHTIKGALLNLGLMDLADVAFQIEWGCNQGDREVDYRKIVREIGTEIRKITGEPG